MTDLADVVKVKPANKGNRRLVLEILADNDNHWMSVSEVCEAYPPGHSIHESSHPAGYARAILNRLTDQGLIVKEALHAHWRQSPQVYRITTGTMYNVWWWRYADLAQAMRLSFEEFMAWLAKHNHPPYVRVPLFDMRLKSGDDFAGDAWMNVATKLIRYTSVGAVIDQEKVYDDWWEPPMWPFYKAA
jgi:hypothetical protein